MDLRQNLDTGKDYALRADEQVADGKHNKTADYGGSVFVSSTRENQWTDEIVLTKERSKAVRAFVGVSDGTKID